MGNVKGWVAKHGIVEGRRALALLVSLTALLGTPAALASAMPEDGEGPLPVVVGVYFLDVDGVDSAEQNFTANVVLQYTWRDASQAHPGPGNVVKPMVQVWNPQIQILNQQKLWKTFPEVVTISPEGEVQHRQRVWGDFSQPLDLREFPLDRQTFTVRLVAAGFSPDQIELSADPQLPRLIAEELSVADWQVVGSGVEAAPFQPMPGGKEHASISFSFTAQRDVQYFVVKVIIPLVLIVMMSWVVFWIDPIEAGTQIGVAMTAMLTLIAYRFAVGTELPRVSYLTRMDSFILAATVLVFASLAEVLVTSRLARSERSDLARRIDDGSRVGFPLVFVAATLWALVF